MTQRIETIRGWLLERTLRERLLILFVGLAVIYLFWNFFLLRPLLNSVKNASTDIIQAKQQSLAIKQQANTIQTIAKLNATEKKLTEQEELTYQSALLKKRINELLNTLVYEEDIPKIFKDLYLPFEGITLIEIKDLANESLIPSGLDVTEINPLILGIVKKRFQLHFQGKYFHVLEYLKHIEQMSWPIYGNSLEYRVASYPNGDVFLSFYVLIKQKS